MIVSANQPYFAPFPGFFLKALRADIFLLMDTVQFPLGSTWLTRNRFKNDHGSFWLNVAVWRKGLGLQRINEVRICHDRSWAKKSLKRLKSAYLKAPFFDEHLIFLEEMFSYGVDRLMVLNLSIIRYVMKYLHIGTEIRLLSDLGIETREPMLSVEVCRRLGATQFLAQVSARRYLDVDAFRKAGIELIFFNPRPPVYPQLWGNYIPNLSIFDLIFNCGPRARHILDKYAA